MIPHSAGAFEIVTDTKIPQGETLSLIIPKYDFTGIAGGFEGKQITFYETTQEVDQSEIITRAEFVQLIALNKKIGATSTQEQKPESETAPLFKDVGGQSAYYPAIRAAVSAGIISGYEDGLFHPFEKITRAQAAKIVMNAYNPAQIIEEIKPFPDVPENHSLKQYIYSAVKAGVFKGYPDGKMLPNRNISFNESNLIIQRAAFLNSTNKIVQRQVYRAFLGINRLNSAGKKILTITTKDLQGEGSLNKSTITVTKRYFPVTRFNLAEDRTKLFGKTYQDNTWELINAAKAKPSGKQLWEGGFIIPAEGDITLGFGNKLYINGAYAGSHFGIDYANAEGTPILAANNGIITFAGLTPSFGNTIVIDHGQNIYTMYLHLKEAQVQTGAAIKKGDQIGLMGETGIATGSHLHFTSFVGDIIVDSKSWFNGKF
jgi:hypothetical protein